MAVTDPIILFQDLNMCIHFFHGFFIDSVDYVKTINKFWISRIETKFKVKQRSSISMCAKRVPIIMDNIYYRSADAWINTFITSPILCTFRGKWWLIPNDIVYYRARFPVERTNHRSNSWRLSACNDSLP